MINSGHNHLFCVAFQWQSCSSIVRHRSFENCENESGARGTKRSVLTDYVDTYTETHIFQFLLHLFSLLQFSNQRWRTMLEYDCRWNTAGCRRIKDSLLSKYYNFFKVANVNFEFCLSYVLLGNIQMIVVFENFLGSELRFIRSAFWAYRLLWFE